MKRSRNSDTFISVYAAASGQLNTPLTNSAIAKGTVVNVTISDRRTNGTSRGSLMKPASHASSVDWGLASGWTDCMTVPPVPQSGRRDVLPESEEGVVKSIRRGASIYGRAY